MARTIVKIEGVCGGEACLSGTRIPVWVLEQFRQLGLSDTKLLLAYPTLEAEDLSEAWHYVKTHPTEIEQAIEANTGAD